MKVTKLEGISSLAIVDNVILYGDLRNAIPADPEHIRQVIDSVEYPLPDVEIIILPFIIDRIDDNAGPVDGVAAYKERKVYLSAFHRLDFTTEAHRQLAWAKTVLHEVGHMVHYEYLPYPAYGAPKGLWQTFCQVGKVPTTNNSYENSLAEAFAEWWRFLFSPVSQSIPHRHGLKYVTGLQAWMRSLPGALTLALEHKAIFHRGEVIPIDVAPLAVQGRTMVPVRFIAENLNRVGAITRVGWIAPETVYIE